MSCVILDGIFGFLHQRSLDARNAEIVFTMAMIGHAVHDTEPILLQDVDDLIAGLAINVPDTYINSGDTD